MPEGEVLVDSRIEASEARTDTKFARLDGKIDLLGVRIEQLARDVGTSQAEGRSNRNLIIVTTIGSALTVLFGVGALVVGLLSYGASTFYNGTVIRDLVKTEMQADGAGKTGTGK